MNDSLPFFSWIIVGGFGAWLANFLVRKEHIYRYLFFGIAGGLAGGFFSAMAYKQVNEWTFIYALLLGILLPEVVEWLLEGEGQNQGKTS